MVKKFNAVHKAIIFFSVIAIGAIIGCKIPPSAEAMYNIATSVGYSAGLIVNQLDMPNQDRNAMIDIVNEVVYVVPETNQTFEAAWTPIADRHVAVLIDEGKIDATQGNIILLGFSALTKGIDWLFDKFPRAKNTKDLVVAVIDGGTTGFLQVVHPVNFAAASVRGVDYEHRKNRDAYQYLRKEVLKLNN